MDSNVIYKVIIDQHEELLSYDGYGVIFRKEADRISLTDNLAQVVIGVRRSGKSTLCRMALDRAGVKYGYVNFDDDKLANLKVEDLNLVLEAVYRVYGNDVKHLFFDDRDKCRLRNRMVAWRVMGIGLNEMNFSL